MNLTLKQEMVTLHYIKNGCSSDQTLKSFPGKLTKATLSKYLKNENVKDYISNMNSQIENTLKINKTKIVAETMDIQHITKEKGDYRTSLQAIKQVSTLLGYDAPTTIDVNVDLSTWLVQQQPQQETIDVAPND